MKIKEETPGVEDREKSVAKRKIMLALVMKQRRYELDLSLKEIQRIIGIDSANISRLESGRANMKLDTFFRLLDGYQLNMVIKDSDGKDLFNLNEYSEINLSQFTNIKP